MRKKPLLEIILTGALALTSCGRAIKGGYERQSLQGRILQDLLDTGNEKTGQTPEGELVIYRAKEFKHEEKNITAYAITYLDNSKHTLGGKMSGAAEWKYDSSTDRWHNMKPGIILQFSEKTSEGSNLTILVDDLTNNPQKPIDLALKVPRKTERFVIPHRISTKGGKRLEKKEAEKLYSTLTTHYEEKFLKK